MTTDNGYFRDGWNIYNEAGDMCGFVHDGAPHLLRDGVIYNWDGVIRGSIENGKVVWIERHLELREFDGAYYERRDLEIYDDKGALCGFYYNFKPYIFDGCYVVNWQGERRGFILGGAITWWSDNIEDLKRYNLAVSAMLSHSCKVESSDKDYELRGNLIHSMKDDILGIPWWSKQSAPVKKRLTLTEYKRFNLERQYKLRQDRMDTDPWWKPPFKELKCYIDNLALDLD
jgi:hypothetical protein